MISIFTVVTQPTGFMAGSIKVCLKFAAAADGDDDYDLIIM